MRRLSATLALLGLTLTLAACAGDSPVAMPDVVGKPLEEAISEVADAGIEEEAEILGGGMFGVVDESNWTVCSQEPPAGTQNPVAPILTVDRECGTEVASEVTPDEEETESAAAEPSPTYIYEGPEYDVVVMDANQGKAGRDQYWVSIAPVDYSSEAYKEQVKLVIEDVAHQYGSDLIWVYVVSDEEIAQAEAASTAADFVEEFGADYAQNDIPQKEVDGWVASYSGGVDPDSGEASESADAFEVLWHPYGDLEIETWRPSDK